MDGDGSVDAASSKEPRTSALWIHREQEREGENERRGPGRSKGGRDSHRWKFRA